MYHPKCLEVVLRSGRLRSLVIFVLKTSSAEVGTKFVLRGRRERDASDHAVDTDPTAFGGRDGAGPGGTRGAGAQPQTRSGGSYAGGLIGHYRGSPLFHPGCLGSWYGPGPRECFLGKGRQLCCRFTFPSLVRLGRDGNAIKGQPRDCLSNISSW